MSHPAVEAVASRVAEQFPETIETLKEYLAIPAISCQEANHGDVRRLGHRIKDDLAAMGLDNARVLELDGALPIVAAEWLKAGADKPTVLVYGHMDLQPVGEPNWRTDPHVAVEQDGRLYARGSADDMGGWISHMAAMRAWFEEAGELPCNLKLIIEGEEEIGSPNLERFMDAFPEVFEADVMVLTDCENPSEDVPGMTISLRGLMEVELVCEALDADGHSGLWGNMVPDPCIALMRAVAAITDDDGRLVPGRLQLDPARSDRGREVPLTDDTIRDGAHLLDGIDPLPVRGRSAAEWLWWQPAVTVVATTLPTPAQKKNAIRRRATATLSVRLAPGQTPEEMLAALEETVAQAPIAGVRVSLEYAGGGGGSWLYEPKGPAFPAADRAYERAWGKPLVHIGIGGSIPFVEMFGRRFSDLPLILNGVLDPLSTAHGPNESMHLGIFRKMLVTNVYLLDELSRLRPDELRGA